jgi:hypothetical protein
MYGLGYYIAQAPPDTRGGYSDPWGSIPY